MFERFTEKARRVMFFARYEASQYGSPFIETEHLLLGLLREDRSLMRRVVPDSHVDRFRKAVESRINIRERISVSVEVPLSQECKRILNYSAEEAERLGHRHVGTEHYLLGILREEQSLAAELLRNSGLTLLTMRDLASGGRIGQGEKTIEQTIDDWGVCWTNRDMQVFAAYFADLAVLVDVRGHRWKGREETAKADAAFLLSPSQSRALKRLSLEIWHLAKDSALAHVEWEVGTTSLGETAPRVRAILLLTESDGDWKIFAAQFTAVTWPPPTYPTQPGII